MFDDSLNTVQWLLDTGLFSPTSVSILENLKTLIIISLYIRFL